METHPALRELRELHDDVERRAAGIARHHIDRLQCRRGCHGCGSDDSTVFEIEAERIRRSHPDLLRDHAPHPPGACAFLDADGACRIYADRPFVCRTGLPLRWLEEDADDEVRERRDICPLNVEGTPLDQLDEASCWWIGPTELKLVSLQSQLDGGAPRRVSLRALFDAPREVTG